MAMVWARDRARASLELGLGLVMVRRLEKLELAVYQTKFYSDVLVP